MKVLVWLVGLLVVVEGYAGQCGNPITRGWILAVTGAVWVLLGFIMFLAATLRYVTRADVARAIRQTREEVSVDD